MDEQQSQEAPGPPPSEELHPAVLLEAMKAHVRAGWMWDAASYTLAHPEHPSRYYRVDPQTHRLSISPALEEAFRSGLERLP